MHNMYLYEVHERFAHFHFAERTKNLRRGSAGKTAKQISILLENTRALCIFFISCMHFILGIKVRNIIHRSPSKTFQRNKSFPFKNFVAFVNRFAPFEILPRILDICCWKWNIYQEAIQFFRAKVTIQALWRTELRVNCHNADRRHEAPST